MAEKKRKSKVWYYAIGVFIAVLIVLFILPAFQIPVKKAPTVVCLAHIHSLNICCRVYHMDEGLWPTKANWCDLLKPYADYGDRNIYQCPNDKIGPCSYAMNENIPDDANDLPDDLVLLFESTPGWNQIGGPDDVLADRHKRSGASIAFADGRVEFVKPEDIPNLRWTVEEE